MFAIVVEFLEGRVIAARPDRPNQLEWPLEPARLFVALAAALHEGRGGPEQRAALEWFEELQPVRIESPHVFERSVVTVYVPVNDRVDDPTQRGKQPRTFPSGYVGDARLKYIFDEDMPASHEKAFSALIQNVVRIGHSSSLVRCTLQSPLEQPTDDSCCTEESSKKWVRVSKHQAAASVSGQRASMRMSAAGTLARLERDYNAEAIEQYAQQTEVILSTKNKKEAALAKKSRDTLFPRQPFSTRPVFGVRSTFVASDRSQRASVSAHTVFDPFIVPLTKLDGNALGLESTLALTTALRNMILRRFEQDAPTWISGHATDGSRTTEPHLAIVPLSHVGRKTNIELELPSEKRKTYQDYADGHIMGLGLVFPRDLSDQAKGAALGGLLFNDLGDPIDIVLTLGNLGEWRLQREPRPDAPRALTPETWSRPSQFWATVTPIVLNRFPKCSRLNDLQGWNKEVGETIAMSCEHIGLERPLAVRVLKHGPLAGVPSSLPERSGFPLLKDSEGKLRGFQVHAVLQFASDIQGPVLLGAGRFRGYGLCKPVEVI